MSFQKSVIEYKSIYFHFLDGLLNTTSGGSLDYVLKTIKDIADINLNQINLADLSFISEKDENLILIKFFSEDSKIYKLFYINYDFASTPQSIPTSPVSASSGSVSPVSASSGSVSPVSASSGSVSPVSASPVTVSPVTVSPGSGSVSPKSPRSSSSGSPKSVSGFTLHESFSEEELTPDHLKEHFFNFCIISISFNKHQTTTIIFKKGVKIFLYILNTGLDITENGNSQKINDQYLYQLCKGICICNDINNPQELVNAYYFIENFLYISYFYDSINREKKIFLKKISYID